LIKGDVGETCFNEHGRLCVATHLACESRQQASRTPQVNAVAADAANAADAADLTISSAAANGAAANGATANGAAVTIQIAPHKPVLLFLKRR
jgi:hypothetical protein